MISVAEHLLMNFFPNLTTAKTKSEKAAKLHNLVTAPPAYSHKYARQRYSGGLSCSGPTATSTTEVPIEKTNAIATVSPASRRLMRKRRIGWGRDGANVSGTTNSPLITPPAVVITTTRMAQAMKPGPFSGPKSVLFILVSRYTDHLTPAQGVVHIQPIVNICVKSQYRPTYYIVIYAGIRMWCIS